MDGEAVEQIINLAKTREAQSRKVFQAPAEPKDVYYLVDGDGDIERVVSEPEPVQVSVRSTGALLELAKLSQPGEVPDFDSDGQGGIKAFQCKFAAESRIYYCDTEAVLVVTDADGEGRTLKHTLPLPLHPVYTKLEELLKTRQFFQKDLIRFLRAELNGNVEDAIIGTFRTLKLKSEGEGESVAEQGRNSISRSLQQTVRAERGDVIPDSITVTTPVYDLDELRTQRLSVEVLVDCVPNEQGLPVFELTTVHSSLRAARYEALRSVAFALEAGVHPVIYGAVQ